MASNESFYHCLECRQVVYLEETDEKVQHRCPDCGPGTFHKIEDKTTAVSEPMTVAEFSDMLEGVIR